MNLTLTGTRLLLEPIFDEEKGLIVVPDISSGKKWNRNTGILHAFSEEVHQLHPELKKGMRVVFKPYSGSNQEIQLRGKTFMLIEVAAVLAVIE